MGKIFELKSGARIEINERTIKIIRLDGKSAMKSLFAGRTMGQMIIKLRSVTGIIQNADYMIICASGLPTPNDFKISSISDVKQYPNCLVGKVEELKEIYDYISERL